MAWIKEKPRLSRGFARLTRSCILPQFGGLDDTPNGAVFVITGRRTS